MGETMPSAGASPPPLPPIIVQNRMRGCGFWLGWFLAFVFFCAAVFFFLCLVGLSIERLESVVPGAKPTLLGGALTEKTIEGSGDNKVLLIPVRGLIGEFEGDSFFSTSESTIQYVRQRLRAARQDKAVKAILLHVDSPGGGVTASDIISQEIRRFKAEEKDRKVVVLMGDVAASGGYYISADADWIIAHPTTLTGSIGVIMMNFDATLLLQKIGVQDNPIKSGPFKDIGSWTRTMTPEERAMLQAMVDEMLGRFVKVISDGRKLPLEKVKALADGRIFTATQAKAAKLIDDIGYYDDALKKIKELTKVKDLKVVRYDKTFSLASLFGGDAEVKSGLRGLEVALRDMAFPRGPRLMYLWTGR